MGTAWRALFELKQIITAPAHSSIDAEPGPTPDRELEAAGLHALITDASAARKELLLVVNDDARATRSELALDAFYRTVDTLGVRVRTRLLVATGTHRRADDIQQQHLRRIAGDHLHRLAGTLWHDARAKRRLSAVGQYSMSTAVAEAEYLLVIGSCEPHYFAGITGAHKTLAIGTLGYEGIEANHAGAMEKSARGLVLHGNPVHEGICHILDELEQDRRIVALNQLLVAGRLERWTSGTPREALARMVPHVHSAFSHAVQQPFDLVIAEVAPPLDRSLYQADKGIKNVEEVVRDGGVLLLDASCDDGVGPEAFLELLRAGDTLDAVRSTVARRGYRLGDHKALRLRALSGPRRVAVGIVAPGLSPDDLTGTGLQLFADREAAAGWARRRLPHANPAALLVEDAGNRFVTSRQEPPS